MLDRTSIKNNKRFLINCSDLYMADMFIEECQMIHSGYNTKKCFNTKEFIEELNGGTLFNQDKKIIALMDFSDENIEDIEPFLSYDTEDILILVEQGALKKNKAYTKIRSDYAYQKLQDMSERECRSWLHTYMTKENLRFSPEIPSYIINRRGVDPKALINEVKKLKYLNREVTESLCSSVICESGNSNFFDFMDHFSHKRTEGCFKEFNKVDESKYVQLLHFIIGQFEKLYKITIYKEQKKSVEEISELVEVPKFIVQTKLYTAISIFNKIKILKAIDLLNDLDVQLRLSKYNNKFVFESYILKIFNL